MGRPHNSILVAEFLQAKALENGQHLDMTQTQKLLYILTGWFWVNHNCRVLHERPKAWIYGPVFLGVLEHFDDETIQRIDNPKFERLKNDGELMAAVDYIIKNYACAEAKEFVLWSMDVDGPWAKTVLKPGFQWYDLISESDIKSYFTQVTF